MLSTMLLEYAPKILLNNIESWTHKHTIPPHISIHNIHIDQLEHIIDLNQSA